MCNKCTLHFVAPVIAALAALTLPDATEDATRQRLHALGTLLMPESEADNTDEEIAEGKNKINALIEDWSTADLIETAHAVDKIAEAFGVMRNITIAHLNLRAARGDADARAQLAEVVPGPAIAIMLGMNAPEPRPRNGKGADSPFIH